MIHGWPIASIRFYSRAIATKTPGADDPPLRPPRDQLSLPAAGIVRRAPHHVSSARQLRPEASGGEPRHHAGRERFRWLHDAAGNCVAIARFAGRAEALRFESRIRLDHSPDNIPDFRLEDYARTYPFSYRPEEMPDLVPAIERQYSDPNQEVYRWVRRFLNGAGSTDTARLLMTLTCAIRESFVYEPRHEPGTRDPALTLKLGRGSCRDLALLMIEAVRSLDLAARFFSGYLYVADREGPQNVGGGATHAWCQVYLPGAGWLEFDPTNGIVGNRT